MKSATLLPSTQKVLLRLGENIKLARLRRKLSTQQVAERANIGRKTLWAIEQGSASVAMGSYAQVLFVLNLEKDLLKVAEDDMLGRKLQDLKLVVKKRAPKRNSTTTISRNKSKKQ
jgi:transcriptional regulator with XRE-family HTH domain